MYCSQRPASFIAWSTSSQRDCSTLLIHPAAADTPRAWFEAEFTHGVFRYRTMQSQILSDAFRSSKVLGQGSTSVCSRVSRSSSLRCSRLMFCMVEY